jgi:hypothetical protein
MALECPKPKCNEPVVVVQAMLGGYLQVRCAKHGLKVVRDPVAAPQPPPTTADEMSREAASSMLDAAGGIRRKVAECIKRHGPVAEWRVEEILGLEGNTVRPRIWELRKAGLVAHLGSGLTPSGRKCHLYALTELGVELVG